MPLEPDKDLKNADWPKRTWNLPPYKSKEFYEILEFSGMTLKHFKTLPVYMFAVEKGLIKNDQWAGE